MTMIMTMIQGHDYKTVTGMVESCLKPEAGGVKPKVEHQFFMDCIVRLVDGAILKRLMKYEQILCINNVPMVQNLWTPKWTCQY